MKIYISGKITGDPNYKEKFKKAFHFLLENKEKLFPEENETYSFFNPADVSLTETATWTDYMKYDLRILIDCDAIYMLKDWQESKGAKLEFTIAKEMGKKIVFET